MNTQLEEAYLFWLYAQVASTRFKAPNRTFWSLLRQLHSKEFVGFVPNDDNRVEDGKDLRHEFAIQSPVGYPDQSWFDEPCSVLEMILGLSRRLSFEAQGQPRDWFWHLMKNLGFSWLSDSTYDEDVEVDVEFALENLVWRKYKRDGRGGLFPLSNPSKDQRKVELWYQLSAYLLELSMRGG